MSIPQTPSPLANVIASKTYNAAWFSGATKEAQITAAIAAAVTDGALYVYVPANMIPYNGTTVTFNSAIQMLREGRTDTSSYDIRAYGLAADNIIDDRAALNTLVNVLMQPNGGILDLVGTVRIGSSVSLPTNITVRPLFPSVLRPLAGASITINGELIAGRVKCLDLSAGGLVVGFLANSNILPEWWGAHNVLGGVTNDDVNATINTAAILASAAVLNDDHIWSLHHQYVINGTITFPNKSWTIIGTSPTGCGFRASTLTPAITLLDFNGCNGPGKIVQDIAVVNPAVGVMGGIGIDTLNANGLWLRNVWFGGMATGLRSRGSFISTTDCAFEFCTTGISFEGAALPEESQHRGLTFYQNVTDIQTAVDMKGTIIQGTIHTNNSGDCILCLAGSKNLHAANIILGTGNTGHGVHFKGSSTQHRVLCLQVYSANAGAFFEDCTDCTVESYDCYGATDGVYIVNTVTAGNKVRNYRAKSASVTRAIRLGNPGARNTIEHFDINTVATGLSVDAGGWSDATVAFKHGRVTGCTTANFTLASACNQVEAFDVFSDSYGDFKSNMDLIANKITVIYYTDLASRKQIVGSKPPTAGTFAVSDRVSNSVATVGQPKAWVCTAAGTPGTWVSEGNL